MNITAEIKDITKSHGPFLAIGLVMNETAHFLKMEFLQEHGYREKYTLKKQKYRFQKNLKKHF